MAQVLSPSVLRAQIVCLRCAQAQISYASKLFWFLRSQSHQCPEVHHAEHKASAFAAAIAKHDSAAAIAAFQTTISAANGADNSASISAEISACFALLYSGANDSARADINCASYVYHVVAATQIA